MLAEAPVLPLRLVRGGDCLPAAVFTGSQYEIKHRVGLRTIVPSSYNQMRLLSLDSYSSHGKWVQAPMHKQKDINRCVAGAAYHQRHTKHRQTTPCGASCAHVRLLAACQQGVCGAGRLGTLLGWLASAVGRGPC